MTDLDKFLRNLRFVYETRGLNQKAVAELAGISGPYLSRILSRQVPLVSFKLCSSLALAVGIEMGDMLREPEDFMLWFDAETSKKPEKSRRRTLVA